MSTFFFNVKTPDEIFKIFELFGPCGQETVPLERGLGRILSRDLLSPEDLPGFPRSAMDGYAVRAQDTFGAGESLPAVLQVSGEIHMGETPALRVEEGQAVRISTGAMLPPGADGVAMIEYCRSLDEETIEVSRAISPLENVIQPGDDFRKNAPILGQGRRLRPQDLGALAGLGFTYLEVFRRPEVGILSTGDELVEPSKTPRPGQVRDINRYTLGAFCLRSGAQPRDLGLCADRYDELKDLVELGLERTDALWVSGGSSVGTRDLTLRVFETLPDFELLAHGISISPGKPTIIGRVGQKPVIGLPGHVASAMVVAEVFMRPLIDRLSGLQNVRSWPCGLVEAELTRNVESKSGREDYIRVKLVPREGKPGAEPIFGKSGLISTLVEADGLLRIDMNAEGLYQGQEVKVMVFDSPHGGRP